jgi:hypothetical protein
MEEQEIKKSGKRDYLVWTVLVLIILNLILIVLVGSLVFGSGYGSPNSGSVPGSVGSGEGEGIGDIEVSDDEVVVNSAGSCVAKSGFSCPEGVDRNGCESAGCFFELRGENNDIGSCFSTVCADLSKESCSGNCVWDDSF